MEQKKRFFRTFLAALLMVGVVVGAGYGVSTTIKRCEATASTASVLSETPMVPANFSDLAEKVRPGVVNLQVVKKVKNVGFGPPGQPLWRSEPLR